MTIPTYDITLNVDTTGNVTVSISDGINVYQDGALKGATKAIDFKTGTNTTVSVVKNGNRMQVTYNSTASGGGGGSGVDSFNGRTGAVSPIQSDYDGFFLTPAEGNAAYQPLDSDLTAIAALSTTAYGRALLALADEAAAQSYLGLSNVTSVGNKIFLYNNFI